MTAAISFSIDLANDQAGQHAGRNERRPEAGCT